MAKLLSQIIYKIRHLIDIKIPNICKLFSHLKHSIDGWIDGFIHSFTGDRIEGNRSVNESYFLCIFLKIVI